MLNSTLCYIIRDGRVLLLYRNKKENDLNEGKWIGVGGKFEPGESADECMIREVFEETGLTVTEYKLHGIVKFISDVWDDQDMYLYTATNFTGELNTDCSEGELHWVDKDEVLKLPTWEGDRYFMEPLLRGDDRIDMLVRYEGRGKDERLAEVRNLTCETIVEKAEGFVCPHAFSTRAGGVSEGVYESLNLGMNRGDIKERVIENWSRFLDKAGILQRDFVCGNQIHGNYVHIATKKDLRPAYGPGELIPADGYVTAEKNVPLAIFTADCVPLLLEDAENGVIGAIHCGWRSTVTDIEGCAIEKMISLGAVPESIRAAIGPAIDMCCFEVGKEVIDAVNNLFGNLGSSALQNSNGDGISEGLQGSSAMMNMPGTEEVYSRVSGLYRLKENGKYMLNLRGVVELRLVQLGVRPENIEWVGGCTLCHPKKYWSHRYTEGIRGSLACVIAMQ